MKSELQIQKNLDTLQKMVEQDHDPILSRIAFEMTRAVLWLTGREEPGWPELDVQAYEAAQLLREEIEVRGDIDLYMKVCPECYTNKIKENEDFCSTCKQSS